MGWSATDGEARARLAALQHSLEGLGWVEGRNLRLDVRWSDGDGGRAAALARELVASRPDLIVVGTTPATIALQRETTTIPIVFTVVADPVGSGLVKTLSHPGGNITGFTNLEPSLVGKWLELLKAIAPNVTRVGIMFNPTTASYSQAFLEPLSVVARAAGVSIDAAHVRSEAEIEAAISAIGRAPNGGLIAMTDGFMVVHRKTAIAAAARSEVPAMYFATYWVEDGGLISYGVDVIDIFRRAASYVDRILRGAEVATLPVEQPTKLELAINRRTASTLGLVIPQSLALRAGRLVD
jgi:putative ABC transport system substrate-binding protein